VKESPIGRRGYNQDRLRGSFASLLVPALLTGGCTVSNDYEWSEYPVKPERITQTIDFSVASSVQITNGQSRDEDEELGWVGAHHFYGSLRELTEAIVAQFSSELAKRNVAINSGGPKSIELKVTEREFIRGFWVIRTDMVLEVQDGSGAVYALDISNTTGGTVPRLYDGAASVATTALLNDPRIKAYLEEP